MTGSLILCRKVYHLHYFSELEREDRPLVIHAADADVRNLKRDFGLKLGRIFDTSLAARILGFEKTGLKDLLHQELGVVIDKGEQRSDWGKRPLSSSQLLYARKDVQHLLALADSLKAKLQQVDRFSWLEEECLWVRDREPTTRVFDQEGWRKVKIAKELDPTGRRVLHAAWTWREKEAQTLGHP